MSSQKRLSLFPPKMLLLSLVSALIIIQQVCRTNHFHANAAEIEATSEWTLLKENDTIPAGLHVKMDLSTGQKWVKLLDDQDEQTKEVPKSTDLIVNHDESSTNEEQEEDEEEQQQSSSEEEEAPPKYYDFETMHRALSKLPDDEKLLIGGIPDIPPPLTSPDYDPETTTAFESRMKDIWTSRQTMLQRAMEQVANLPDILNERIRSIRSYLTNGYSSGGGDDIVEVLADLEYQLNDMDMARDFHTLGGWPLLVSLLSEEAHHVSTNGNETVVVTTMDPTIKAQIQSMAAWAIGTAVKNTREFFPWALEDISSSSSSTTRTTPISLLLQTFQSDNMTLKQKSLYAIGSLLRGNKQTYPHFLSLNGPSILVRSLQTQLQTNHWKLAIKIVQLGTDLISNVLQDDSLGGGGDDDEIRKGEELVNAVTTEEWCMSIVEILNAEDVKVKEKGLESMKVMGKYCNIGKEVIEALREGWMTCEGEMECEEIDEEWRKELMELAGEVLDAMEE